MRRFFAMGSLPQPLGVTGGRTGELRLGHSHQPSAVQKNGILLLNPGCAGLERFVLPVSLALLRVTGKLHD